MFKGLIISVNFTLFSNNIFGKLNYDYILFICFLLCISVEDSLSSEFSLLMSKTLNYTGPERLFSIAFVFTLETGFIPISLADHFESVNSNIKLTKMIKCQPLNLFWHQYNNVFNAQLVMSNQLCQLTGVLLFYNGLNHICSLIVTLSYSNISKCTILEVNNTDLRNNTVNYEQLSLNYKNMVSVPIKCSILDFTTGQYPSLCGIPEELIICIMKKLNASDLYALMRCCKKLSYLANSNQCLWRELAETEFQTNTAQLTITDWKDYFYSLKIITLSRNKPTLISNRFGLS